MIRDIFAAPKTPNNENLEEGIAFAQAHGIGYEAPVFYSPTVLDNHMEEVRVFRPMLNEFTGLISVHGPIFDMNPVSLDPAIEAITLNRYVQAIEVAKALKAKYLVVHSQYTPIYEAAGVMKKWLHKTTDFWEGIIEKYLEDSHLTVVVENFLDPDPEGILTLVSRLNSPHLKACLDIGHTNIFSKMPPSDWLDALGSHLAYVHAHNNDSFHDDHQSFEVGTLDMDAFLNHLVLTTHKIDVALETNSIEGMGRSLEMLKPYLELQNNQFKSKSFLV